MEEHKIEIFNSTMIYYQELLKSATSLSEKYQVRCYTLEDLTLDLLKCKWYEFLKINKLKLKIFQFIFNKESLDGIKNTFDEIQQLIKENESTDNVLVEQNQ